MSELRFSDKVAIVTGGASGIGEALVRILVKDGAKVCIADVNTTQGQSLSTQLPTGATAFQRCDVSIQSEVDDLVAFCVKTFGGLDLLFNNAGIAPRQLVDSVDLDTSEWLRLVATNLNSVFYTCHAAIPELRKRGGGAIVNTASISGALGEYGVGAYCASKGAVINYTRALALDHARDKIRVNAICPGFVHTPLTAGVTGSLDLQDKWDAVIPMGRGGQPREIANVMAFLASDEASYVTGGIVMVDGGITAHSGQPDLLSAIKTSSAASK